MGKKKCTLEEKLRDLSETQAIYDRYNAKRRRQVYDKLIAEYNMYKELENRTALTNAEKAMILGISQHKYQYNKRVVHRYPTEEELLKAAREYNVLSVSSVIQFAYKHEQKPKKPKETTYEMLMKNFRGHLKRHCIAWTDPDVTKFLKALQRRVPPIHEESHDLYFEYQPCACCGAVSAERFLVNIKEVDGLDIEYPVCPDCHDENKEPSEIDLLKVHYMYGRVMRRGYDELLSTL